jgi:hypothetical protein
MKKEKRRRRLSRQIGLTGRFVPRVSIDNERLLTDRRLKKHP